MSKKNRKKITEDQQLRERQKMSIKSMYFNRFLLVRYTLAIFFFANFFWALLSWGSPVGYFAAVLVLLALAPIFEMFKMYGKTKPEYRFTKFYFWLQWVITSVMLVLSFTSFSFIYPFLNSEMMASRAIGFGISAFGCLMATLVVRRIGQIDHGTDKQFQRIQYFETKYRLHV